MTVLVAGGGIGGLTVALSLHQIGVPVKVFESVTTLKPLGVGINVLPHACRELIELGLLDRLDETGVRTKELAYFSKHGKPIWSEPRGLDAGYKWPQVSIHRGILHQLLLDATRERIGTDNILTGHHLRDWTETADGVRAHFVNKDGDDHRRLRRRPADRRRRHPFGDARQALSAGRRADLERPHPVARRHRGRAVSVRPHHDHGRAREPEIRLLPDFARRHRTRPADHQLDRRTAAAAGLPVAPRGLQPRRQAR